jgi:hypothetical protein
MALYPEGTAPLPMDDVQRAANKSNVLARQALGQNGSSVGIDGGVPIMDYVAVQMLTDCTFDELITDDLSDFDSLLAFTFPAGTIIYGNFKAVSATGGKFIAYKAG